MYTSLQEGLWGAPPNWSRSLVTYRCPANYCNCTGIAGERSIEGCALIFTNASLSCNPNRKGLCNVARQSHSLISSLTLLPHTPSSLHPHPSHFLLTLPHPSTLIPHTSSSHSLIPPPSSLTLPPHTPSSLDPHPSHFLLTLPHPSTLIPHTVM